MDSEQYPTKEKLMSTIFKLVHKIDIERTFPNSFYEATINLIPKPYKGSKKESIDQYPL